MYGTWKQVFLLTDGDAIEHSIVSEQEYLLVLSSPLSPDECMRYGMVHVKYPHVVPKEGEEPELRVLCAGKRREEMEAFLDEYRWLDASWTNELWWWNKCILERARALLQ